MQTTLKTLALLRYRETAADVTNCLSAAKGIELKVTPQSGALKLPEADELPDVLLYEVTEPDAAELAQLERFITHHHGRVTVLAIGGGNNPELLRRLMRAGVRDVLPSPVERQELLAACTQLLSDLRAHKAGDNEPVHAVCTFMNAKGGCGATTLAVNVAAILAHDQKINVCLMDFDIGFGACAHILDMKPASFVTDALQQSERLDEVFLKALMTTHSSGVHVLASPSSPALAARTPSPEAIRKLLAVAVESYDVVIVDLPRSTEPWVLEVLRASTRSFFVMQNTLSIIRDMRLLLDYMPHAGVDAAKVEVVNNRAMAKSQSVSIEQLKETLGRERIHRVRNDYTNALAAADQGIPVYKVAASSELTQDLRHLATSIWQTHEPAATARAGFLSRLFGNHKNQLSPT